MTPAAAAASSMFRVPISVVSACVLVLLFLLCDSFTATALEASLLISPSSSSSSSSNSALSAEKGIANLLAATPTATLVEDTVGEDDECGNMMGECPWGGGGGGRTAEADEDDGSDEEDGECARKGFKQEPVEVAEAGAAGEGRRGDNHKRRLQTPLSYEACKIYMYDSEDSNRGRGVYAGRDLKAHEEIEVGVTLLLEDKFGGSWTLRNYVYGGGDEDDVDLQMLVFGASMIYSHDNVQKNTEHYWSDMSPHLLKTQKEGYSESTTVKYATSMDVKAGDELFTSYGADEEWFAARGITLIEHPPIDNNDTSTTTVGNATSDGGSRTLNRNRIDLQILMERGHCLSDVFVGESSLPLAGKGLFAARSFKEGEYVTISPVLLLPKNEVFEATQESKTVLANYLITEYCSNIAVLPIGLAALINHDDSDNANLEYSWFDSKGIDTLVEKLSQLTEEILASRNAPLELVYQATRDIDEGEELTIFYGKDWIYSWSSYLSRRIIASQYNDESPRFISPIQATNLFPEHWHDIRCGGEPY